MADILFSVMVVIRRRFDSGRVAPKPASPMYHIRASTPSIELKSRTYFGFVHPIGPPKLIPITTHRNATEYQATETGSWVSAMLRHIQLQGTMATRL